MSTMTTSSPSSLRFHSTSPPRRVRLGPRPRPSIRRRCRLYLPLMMVTIPILTPLMVGTRYFHPGGLIIEESHQGIRTSSSSYYGRGGGRGGSGGPGDTAASPVVLGRGRLGSGRDGDDGRGFATGAASGGGGGSDIDIKSALRGGLPNDDDDAHYAKYGHLSDKFARISNLTSLASTPPSGFPWYCDDAPSSTSFSSSLCSPLSSYNTTTETEATMVDMDTFLNRFQNLLTTTDPNYQMTIDGRGVQSIPYIIQNGIAYTPTSHFRAVQTFDWFGYWYRDRIRPFHELLGLALRIGMEVRHLDERIDRVVTGGGAFGDMMSDEDLGTIGMAKVATKTTVADAKTTTKTLQSGITTTKRSRSSFISGGLPLIFDFGDYRSCNDDVVFRANSDDHVKGEGKAKAKAKAKANGNDIYSTSTVTKNADVAASLVGKNDNNNTDVVSSWPRFTFAMKNHRRFHETMEKETQEKEGETLATTKPTSKKGQPTASSSSCTPFAIPGYDSWTHHHNKMQPDDWNATFERNELFYPWENKVAKAIWRGSTTGDSISSSCVSDDEGDSDSNEDNCHKDDDWRALPRAVLVQYSIENFDVLDAGFTKIVQRNSEEIHEIRKESRFVKGMKFEHFMKYKAVVDIDGNSWSSRFGQLLCTNSVVIKVEPKFVEYFFQELKPWVHYLPVKQDMSNLIDVVEYAISNDNTEQMQNIITNANVWCQHKMTSVQMAIDLLWILVSYSEVLDKSSHSRWRSRRRSRSSDGSISGSGSAFSDSSQDESNYHGITRGESGDWRETWWTTTTLATTVTMSKDNAKGNADANANNFLDGKEEMNANRMTNTSSGTTNTTAMMPMEAMMIEEEDDGSMLVYTGNIGAATGNRDTHTHPESSTKGALNNADKVTSSSIMMARTTMAMMKMTAVGTKIRENNLSPIIETPFMIMQSVTFRIRRRPVVLVLFVAGLLVCVIHVARRIVEFFLILIDYNRIETKSE